MSEIVAKVVRSCARPPGRVLARLGVSPNALTLFGTTLNCALGIALSLGLVLPGPLAGAVVLGVAFFDALDGAVARQLNRATTFGDFLDSVTDRVSDCAVLLGLLIHHHLAGDTFEVTALGLSLIGFPLVSYTRAKAEALGYECRVGLMSRPVRTILLGASLIVGAFQPVITVLAGGTLLTALRRVVHVAGQSKAVPAAPGEAGAPA